MTWFLAQSPVIQGLLATLFTYTVTALGAGTVLFCRSMNQRVLSLMMGFSAGVMLAASFWSLLAPAAELSMQLGGNPWLIPALGFVLGGGFVMAAEGLLSRALGQREGQSARKRSILLGCAVTLHNIPEGLAVGVAFGSVPLGLPGAGVISALMLALGVGVQNFPEGICVALPLRSGGLARRKSFLLGQASGAVEPVAGLLGALFALKARSVLPLALSFSAGAMIAAACGELIPEAFRGTKTAAAAGLLTGFVTMMVLDIALA